MIKNRTNTLTAHIWGSFIGFSLIIFLGLLIFQNIFYERFYDSIKETEILNIALQVEKTYEAQEENYLTEIYEFSVRNNLSVIVFQYDDSGFNLVYNPTNLEITTDSSSESSTKINLGTFCTVIDNSPDEYEIFRDMELTEDGVFVFGSIMNIDDEEYYLYVNSPIVNSELVIAINQWQLLITSIISLTFGILIAYWFSKRLSRPILDLNEAAQRLSNGDYSVVFPNEGFIEVKELGQSLNKAKDEMQKTNQLQKELIANVSHDLRTPLTIIKSYAEMIRDLTGDDKLKRERQIEVIIAETNRLSSLVTDVLQLSKLQLRTKSLELKETNIGDLITESIKTLEFAINENKQQLILEIDDNLYANVDASLMKQVIYNFVLNAITYTNNVVNIVLKLTKDGIRMDVIDDGIGINENEIKQIWDRYYRSEDNHERHKVGSGLGLSIVKTILDEHKFIYGVNSTKDVGSDFYFIIPFEEESNE